MTQKQYIFWNSGAIWQAPATAAITIDRWVNIQSAKLSWQIEGTNGFDNIQINGVTVAEGNDKRSGNKDVKGNLIQGAKNTVKINYQTPPLTIMGIQQAGAATVVLTVIGTMNASYETILAQNAVFKNARQNNQISDAEYKQALATQNSQLQQLLAQGDITSQQYQDAITLENLEASTITQEATETTNGSGNSGNSGGDSTLPDAVTELTGKLQLEYFGLPIYAWIIIAAVLAAIGIYLLTSGKTKQLTAAVTGQ